ncbi:MAG: diguanylate cyclase [Clostridia bacterium]|nr:diguanylate cyclase [Clostridia bacterium]
MKEFQILRYLSKGKFVILLVALLGALGVYYYASSKQVYTATTVIRYANGAISEGLAPNGAKLDVKEIYSTTVIKGAIEDLGLNCSIDEIRSKIKVEAIIPETEQQKEETALSRGDDYWYFPTDYKITYQVDSEKSRDYAGTVLDAVINNYYKFYSERYVDQLILPNNAANISSNDYDYIESAEILQESVEGIDDYLMQKRSMYPEFRASATGYTFADLENIYSYISKNKVPHIYASILQGKYTKDNDLLLKKFQDRIEKYDISMANNKDKSAKLKYLIDNYSEKGINSTLLENQDSSNDSTGSSIIMDVDWNRNEVDVTTTYDALIQEYVQINQFIRNAELDKEHVKYLKSVFINNPKNQVLSAEVEQDIEELVATLKTEYILVKETARELNEYIGASYLNILNSVVTSQTVNIKLYIVLSLAFFLVFGCVGAVFIGRIKDFIQYILYTDKITKLPNRQMCDIEIGSMSEKKLSEQFTCIVFELSSLNEVNAELGRSAGDTLLADFGRIIRVAAKRYGFIGYNGVGQFLGIFEQCSASRVKLFIDRINKNIKEYNSRDSEIKIRISVGYSNSTEDKLYDIRSLIRRSFEKME